MKMVDRAIKNTMLMYIDIIYVNEGLVPAAHVREHLPDYGLTCKDTEGLEDETKVLGFQIWQDNSTLSWRWGRETPNTPLKITCRSLFSLYGRCGSFSG